MFTSITADQWTGGRRRPHLPHLYAGVRSPSLLMVPANRRQAPSPTVASLCLPRAPPEATTSVLYSIMNTRKFYYINLKHQLGILKNRGRGTFVLLNPKWKESGQPQLCSLDGREYECFWQLQQGLHGGPSVAPPLLLSRPAPAPPISQTLSSHPT